MPQWQRSGFTDSFEGSSLFRNPDSALPSTARANSVNKGTEMLICIWSPSEMSSSKWMLKCPAASPCRLRQCTLLSLNTAHTEPQQRRSGEGGDKTRANLWAGTVERDDEVLVHPHCQNIWLQLWVHFSYPKTLGVLGVNSCTLPGRRRYIGKTRSNEKQKCFLHTIWAICFLSVVVSGIILFPGAVETQKRFWFKSF